MGSRQQDKIVKVQEPSERMGGEKKESSPMYLRVVGRKKDRNITPLLGSTSAAMLVLLHQDAKLAPVQHLDPLEDSSSSHASSASCQG